MEEFIIKVLDPSRVEEVTNFLLQHFRICAECRDFFDGEGDFCSPNCDLAYHHGQEGRHCVAVQKKGGVTMPIWKVTVVRSYFKHLEYLVEADTELDASSKWELQEPDREGGLQLDEDELVSIEPKQEVDHAQET